jgi:hypothetical protein
MLLSRLLLIFEKVLKNKYQKWVHIFHVEIWNTNYDENNGEESNW